MSQIYLCRHLEELPNIAKTILQENKQAIIFTFHGNLGAGKTSLIKQLCAKLGFHGNVTSPTFSIINHYIGENIAIYHMDLYRLKDEDEAFEIGLEEYLYSDQYCFIEWPQLAEELLIEPYYKINIKVDAKHVREIEVTFIQNYR